jgi:hypothetical protein
MPLFRTNKTKLGFCKPCKTGGNCQSGLCSSVSGVCEPTSNPCANRKQRQNFKCRNGRPYCCGHGKCDAI